MGAQQRDRTRQPAQGASQPVSLSKPQALPRQSAGRPGQALRLAGGKEYIGIAAVMRSRQRRNGSRRNQESTQLHPTEAQLCGVVGQPAPSANGVNKPAHLPAAAVPPPLEATFGRTVEPRHSAELILSNSCAVSLTERRRKANDVLLLMMEFEMRTGCDIGGTTDLL